MILQSEDLRAKDQEIKKSRISLQDGAGHYVRKMDPKR
jgi:hypothetical protein